MVDGVPTTERLTPEDLSVIQDEMVRNTLRTRWPWATRYNVRYLIAAAILAAALGVAVHFYL